MLPLIIGAMALGAAAIGIGVYEHVHNAPAAPATIPSNGSLVPTRVTGAAAALIAAIPAGQHTTNASPVGGLPAGTIVMAAAGFVAVPRPTASLVVGIPSGASFVTTAPATGGMTFQGKNVATAVVYGTATAPTAVGSLTFGGDLKSPFVLSPAQLVGVGAIGFTWQDSTGAVKYTVLVFT